MAKLGIASVLGTEDRRFESCMPDQFLRSIMVSLLISILILVAVVLVLCWVVDLLPLPPNIGMIVKVIIGLVALVKILGMLGFGI